jgi:hypothetical protein
VFVVFALPAFFFVRERPRPVVPDRRTAVRGAWRQFGGSFRQVRRYPRVFRFLGGRFLYSDAIVTLNAFLAVYMARLGGFSESDKNLALGIVVVAWGRRAGGRAARGALQAETAADGGAAGDRGGILLTTLVRQRGRSGRSRRLAARRSA